MKIKTSELTGAALDWAVAKCLGVDYISFLNMHQCGHFHFSTDWAEGGPIIEREKISVIHMEGTQHWIAMLFKPTADTTPKSEGPLIAAMRCYCCSKLGDEIDIPEELCQQQNS